ncbi:fimbrial protein [Edwardsiella piscicida]|uniref:fimbrial protein n=1 Tax=Edwardsiella piscicida TaxID=1263550 RepID=UPI00290B9234|nr:fimbrial protein [Edwardsiella piscicida]
MLSKKTKCLSAMARARWLGFLLGASIAPPLSAVSIGVNTFNDVAQIAYGDNVVQIDGGIIRANDGYSSINGFRLDDVGDSAGRHFRDNSLFSVTLTGYQHGQTIQLPIKLGRTTFNTRSTRYSSFDDHTTVVNNGCVNIQPDNVNAAPGEQTIDIDPGNDISRNCTGNTVEFSYRNIQPAQGIRREVLFDLPTMMRSEVYQRLPPDLYFIRTNISGLEHWQARVGGSRDFPLPLSINIRKQAYFTGISLPATTLPLRVTYADQRVRGSASMPITLQGAFDPQFGRVRLSARSSGSFSLRNGSSEIPYRAEAVVNQQRYALNDGSNASAPVVLGNLNDVRQIPLQLEVTFDSPRSQISVSGSYRDNLTLIAEVPFV